MIKLYTNYSYVLLKIEKTRFSGHKIKINKDVHVSSPVWSRYRLPFWIRYRFPFWVGYTEYEVPLCFYVCTP